MDRNNKGKKAIKKVLIIAQRFPPAGGVGTFRVTKFVKYLPEFGWNPIVLTVRENSYQKGVWRDRGLEQNIANNINVYRTKVWQTQSINDEGIRWLPFLLQTLFKVIRKERPLLVYITGGPFFPLIVGPIVKLFFRLPYVADLRDPWRTARMYQPSRGLKLRISQVLIRIMEPIVFRFATKVICVTKTMLKEYLSVYPQYKKKFLVITNGYDPEDFKNLKAKQYKKFTIAYTGKFERTEAFHNPTLFFNALKILHDKGADIKFVHVGAKEEKVIVLAKKTGVRSIIKFIGPKPYYETLSYAIGADLLLVIGSSRKMGLPVKMFDYIGCRKPILILAYKDEEIWHVGQEIPSAILLENNNSDDIAYLIEELYRKDKIIELSESVGVKYHRRNLTHKLSKVFNEILSSKEEK
jgi:glycosyltransferase involved in cell wall biosynthesis